ncbi:MAG: hypothetical protein MRJ92_04300 [Nitrospira sp.]|nr:hypothetical protein [Nitrospira sp.]
MQDPYYVLPIIMGATMVIQQKITPTMDPTQAKIMLFLPVFMTFSSYEFPCGLGALLVDEQYAHDRPAGGDRDGCSAKSGKFRLRTVSSRRRRVERAEVNGKRQKGQSE